MKSPDTSSKQTNRDIMSVFNFEDSPLKSGLRPLLKLTQQSLQVPLVAILEFATSQQLVENAGSIAKSWQNDVSQQLASIIEETGKALIIDNSTEQSKQLAILSEDIRACAGLPIKLSNGDLWGMVAIIDKQSRQWTASDISHLEQVVDSLAAQINAEIERQQHIKQIEALENSENLFQQLADTSTDALIILDEDACIAYCNRATETIFGYTLNDLIRQPIEILTQGTLHNSMDSLILTAFDSYQRTSDWQGLRVTGRRKDGTEFPVELTLDLVRTREQPLFKLIVRDVSRQVMIESGLRADSTRYLQILDAMPDLVYVKNDMSQLIWANKAFQDFFDMPLSNLIGKLDLGTITDSQQLENLKEDQDVFTSASERRRYEEGIVRHDGNSRDFITTKTPIFDEEGNPELLVAVSTDITDSKNLERYLTEALEKNQELVTLKSYFISMVSHEFRTPLSVIQSSTDILTTYYERLSDERRFDKLKTIKNQVSRLTKLMNDVLLVSKGDATGMPFKPALQDAAALTQSIIEEININYQEESISIDFVSRGDCTQTMIDSDLFRHIVQNLLSNAVKYSRTGTIVNVNLTCTSESLTLVVTDQGIGIPEANQENLFHTFHRANNVGTIQGTGLGLAIVKRAVETHHGTINFRSIENEGTMFIVKLPVGASETNSGADKK